MNRKYKSILALSAASYFAISQRKVTFAGRSSFYFESASTLNPKFDKRYKNGEDALLARPQFLCVLDGVGGWIEVLIDSGTMTKEYIGHVASIVDNEAPSNLLNIMDEAK